MAIYNTTFWLARFSLVIIAVFLGGCHLFLKRDELVDLSPTMIAANQFLRIGITCAIILEETGAVARNLRTKQRNRW